MKGTQTASVTPAVSGSNLTGVRAQVFTAIPDADFQAVSTKATISKPTDIVFGAADADGSFPMSYISGSGTLLGGTYSGKGCYYVGSNLTISGNSNYADSSSRAVFYVGGTLKISATATSIVGTYYVAGKVQLNGSALTISRGNLCSAGQIGRSGTLTIVQDQAFVDITGEARRFKAPGIWTR